MFVCLFNKISQFSSSIVINGIITRFESVKKTGNIFLCLLNNLNIEFLVSNIVAMELSDSDIEDYFVIRINLNLESDSLLQSEFIT